MLIFNYKNLNPTLILFIYLEKSLIIVKGKVSLFLTEYTVTVTAQGNIAWSCTKSKIRERQRPFLVSDAKETVERQKRHRK